MSLEENIIAIATPIGEGSIAILRLSGAEVINIVDKFFSPYQNGLSLKARNSHSLSLGFLYNEKGEKLDEVLIGLMRAPHSYTGENVVEINCHGGVLVARQILDFFLGLGLSLASAGEFTKRAFLNGRLPLAQAEAIIDIIRAKSKKAKQLALNNLQGYSQNLVDEIEDNLLSFKALLEASLDFPDEVGDMDLEESKDILLKSQLLLRKMLQAAKKAEVYRDGIQVVICGRPNVGKSSLLNALLKKEKAIVTDIPGTTRDIIEDYIQIKGIPVKLVDTAGIRLTEDYVEKIGVERSKNIIEKADLSILVLDLLSGIDVYDLELYQNLNPEKTIVLLNKDDLSYLNPASNLSQEQLKQYFGVSQVIRTSLIEARGLEDLESSIEKIILNGQDLKLDLEIMVNHRQKQALNNALQYLIELEQNLSILSLDCLAIDITSALEALGEITGKSLNDAAIERIFKDFCIGK